MENYRTPAPVLIAGLPASGKSTFIAALWHVLTNSGQSRFAVTDFAGNREYIQQLEQIWLAANQMPRTLRTQDAQVSIRVDDRSSGRRFILSLPDLSGEDFLAYFARREWPETLDEFVRDMSGVVLFVNPQHVVQPTLIRDLAALAEAAGANPALVGGAVAAEASPSVRWDAEKAPTAVILVDLLSAMSERRALDRQPMRVGVVVSAWDTMHGAGVSPEEWLARDLALFHQYLLSNPELYQCEVYGVSAQGGDVTDQATRDRLLAIVDPTDRVEVISPQSRHKDLSAPIVWVMGPAIS